MIIILNKELFYNDFLYTQDEYGNTVVVNTLNEKFTHDGSTITIDSVNIVYEVKIDEDTAMLVPCPTVIGMSNEYLRVFSDYPELSGKKIDSSNIDRVKIEVFWYAIKSSS